MQTNITPEVQIGDYYGDDRNVLMPCANCDTMAGDACPATCPTNGQMSASVDAAGSRPGDEGDYLVPVVFDVTGARSESEAVALVADALRMRDGGPLRVVIDAANAAHDGPGEVEAWWFPEPGHKEADGNDRPAATLRWIEDDPATD